ncbi:MAG: YukJ family protein [Halanaerobiales bacterium]
MVDDQYGVLIGNVKKIEPDLAGEKTPHYNIIIKIEKNEEFNAAINCQSTNEDYPRVLYYVDEDFEADIVNKLKEKDYGFHKIEYKKEINPGIAVDYIRSSYCNKEDMKVLSYDIEGDNDLKGFIDKNMKRALNDDNVILYVYGTYYDDDNSNNRGVHNIHMNQGNRGAHYQESEIYRDGCFFMYFSEEDRWIANFIAFQNQSWNTDEKGRPKD